MEVNNTSQKLLMVRPFRFEFNDETAVNNFFQHQTEDKDETAKSALMEFDQLVEKLRQNNVEVIVVQDTASPHTPDSVFPNNIFSSHATGELVLYPMFAKNRRVERKPQLIDILTKVLNHDKVIDLTAWENTNEFLEGTGSVILDRENKIAYCCRSPRASEKVLLAFCKAMGYEYILFSAFDKDNLSIYHTNVMMTVGSKHAVICLETIRNLEERERVVKSLKENGKSIISISLDQIEYFVANILEIKDKQRNPIIVMSETARRHLTEMQLNSLEKYAKIISSDISTIEKNGGGSARCMIAEIMI